MKHEVNWVRPVICEVQLTNCSLLTLNNWIVFATFFAMVMLNLVSTLATFNYGKIRIDEDAYVVNVSSVVLFCLI
jgi:hypothetical protein